MNSNSLPIDIVEFDVVGMHCSACEVLIEKKAQKIKGVQAAEASLAEHKLTLQLADQSDPHVLAGEINDLLKEDGYSVTHHMPHHHHEDSISWWRKQTPTHWVTVALVTVIVAIILTLLQQQFAGLNTNLMGTTEAGPALTLAISTGLIAGFSSCAALIGGLLLSLSSQWESVGGKKDNNYIPHGLFHAGRLLSFAIGGALLGGIGQFFRLTFEVNSVLTILISLLMVGLGGQMLGIPGFESISLRLPKNLRSYIVNEQNFQGRYMPFLLGFLTFFIPCGFTLIAYSVALASGSAVIGFVICFGFALGTLPSLAGISFLSIKGKETKFSDLLTHIFGLLVIALGLKHIDAQLTGLNLPSVSNTTSVSGLVELVLFLALIGSVGYGIVKLWKNFWSDKHLVIRLISLILFMALIFVALSLFTNYNLVPPWNLTFTYLR